MKIIIVDDKQENLYMLETLLRANGYETVKASNGEEALKIAKDLPPPDMIISDILMPVMDGFQLCRLCKSDETLKKIPFVFYTATYLDEKDETFAYEIGADMFLRKPMDPDAFLEAILDTIKNTVKGKITPREPVKREAEEIFKLYSERLIQKLEKKMQDLEEELAARNEAEKEVRFRSFLLDSINDFVFVHDLKGNIFYVNETTCKRYGYKENELFGIPLHKLDTPEYSELIESRIESLLKNGEAVFESAHFKKDGSVMPVEIHSRLIDIGEKKAILSVARDITKRKKDEKAFEESESRYRTVFQNTGTATVIIEEDKIISLANEEFEKLSGYPKSEIEGRLKWADFVADKDQLERMKEYHARRREKKGEVPLEYDFRFIDKYGNIKEIHNKVSLIPGTKRSIASLIDITRIKESERELRVRNQIAHIFLTTPDETMYEKVLALVLDITGSRYGIFGFINEAEEWVCPSLTRDIWDQCRITDKSIVFPREKWGGLWGKAMAERRSLYSNHPLNLPEGHLLINSALDVPLIYRDRLVGNFLVGEKEKGYDENDKSLLETVASHVAPILSARLARDTEQRERKIAEDRLLQAQKMEAIGTLAGGIAHDFNNILSAIIGFTELAMEQVSNESPLYSDLQEVYKGGERARSLVRHILAFSRQEEEGIAPIQIAPVLKEALKMLRATLPATIEIRQQIDPELGNIMADPTQIHQIIMNLCTNAGHAMREKGGILEVNLSKAVVNEDSARQHPNLQPGEFIRLSVSDTGHGISPEVLKKIFDPYFTTKRREEGTGLGLSVVHGIVKAYGGVVSVYSEPEKGTIIHVYLPVIQQDIHPVEDNTEPIPGGNERILFVDNEISIVKVGKRMLEQLGYRVETRTDPIEALELFRSDPAQFDLVITDMTMPRMTGDMLAQEVMKIRPDMPVILCSGFSENMTREKALELGIKDFIMKPLIQNELSFAIRKAIGD